MGMFSKFQKWAARFRSEKAVRAAPVVSIPPAPPARGIVAELVASFREHQERPASKLTEALAQRTNPGMSFSGGAHSASRKEIANLLALLICDRENWRDLGDNQH